MNAVCSQNIVLLICLYQAVLSTNSALRSGQQLSSTKWSSAHHYGIFHLIILFPGGHSPFISREMLCLWLPASLQVLTVIRASFLFSSGLAGQYDRCQAPAEVETNYRWRRIVYHTNTSLSLYVSVCLSPLTFSPDPWLFKWINALFCHSHRRWDKYTIWSFLSVPCEGFGLYQESLR